MLVLYLKFYVLHKVFCSLTTREYVLKRRTWTLLFNLYLVVINNVNFGNYLPHLLE